MGVSTLELLAIEYIKSNYDLKKLSVKACYYKYHETYCELKKYDDYIKNKSIKKNHVNHVKIDF